MVLRTTLELRVAYLFLIVLGSGTLLIDQSVCLAMYAISVLIWLTYISERPPYIAILKSDVIWILCRWTVIFLFLGDLHIFYDVWFATAGINEQIILKAFTQSDKAFFPHDVGAVHMIESIIRISQILS